MNSTGSPPEYDESPTNRSPVIGWRLTRTLSRSTVMTNTAPPSYSGRALTSGSISDEDSFAKTKLATGRKKVTPFVSVQDLRDHLKLLRVFHILRDRVREGSRTVNSDHTPLTGDAAWDTFLARAVWRFELWTTKVLTELPANAVVPEKVFEHGFKGEEMPPLDVCLVWHTYSLNPRTYYEDGLRMHPNLRKRGAFPLNEIASRVDVVDGIPVPVVAQVQRDYFASATGHPFDYTTAMYEDDVVTVNCPNCSASMPVRWWSSSGLGLAQKGFLSQCSRCRLDVKLETFGIARLIDDLASAAKEKRGSLSGHYIIGITGDPISELNIRVPKGLRELPGWRTSITLETTRDYYKASIGWDVQKAGTYVRNALDVPVNDFRGMWPFGIMRIMKCYVPHYGPFSLDLMSAIKRQMAFTEKMVALQWASEEHGGPDDATLKLCIKQYHCFLDLMAQEPSQFFVPTLGIDLAWHTHQLSHEDYRLSTKRCVGVFVNHEDTVEQGKLSTSFEVTAKRWQQRFKVPYVVCGCPTVPPPSNSVLGNLFMQNKTNSSAATPEYSQYTHASEHDFMVKSNVETPQSDIHKGGMEEPSGSTSHEPPFSHTANSLGPYDGRVLTPVDFNQPGKCAVGFSSGGACRAGNVKSMYGRNAMDHIRGPGSAGSACGGWGGCGAGCSLG